MTTRYVKTEAGRQAIRERQQGLSRPARNLLLIMDGQRAGAEWVTLVQGSTEADLAQLIETGLIEATAGSAASAPAPVPTPASPIAAPSAPSATAAAPAAPATPAPAPSVPPVARPADPAPEPVDMRYSAPAPAKGMTAQMPEDDTRPVTVRLQEVSYRQLYDTMTSQARPLLGLIKGYRMVLDVEKCNGPDELRRLALRFIDEVRAAQGVGAAYRITEALCKAPEA